MNRFYTFLLFFISLTAFSQEVKREQVKNENALKTDTILTASYILQDGDDVDFANKVPSHSFLQDSVVYTLLDHPGAARIDSLWQRALFKSSLYNNYREKLLKEEYHDVVFEKLPTDTLKKRLSALDAKTPFKIEYNPHLEKVIKSYLQRNKKAMEGLMALSAYYFPMFEEKFSKYNIPLEIKYLAIVESTLNPRARSWVGATGLWQFMYATGKMNGLEVSSYVDERMDPVKSTEAAAQYLSTLYSIFEDWDLVLASYNSGPGNVSKAIRRSGGATNYWKLRPYLPRETARYVPAFQAIMYVFEYAEEHGFQPPVRQTTFFETDTLQTHRKISFEEITKVTGVEKELLEFLNPSYKLNIIPDLPNKNYALRLPKEKIGIFVNNEEEIYAYIHGENTEKQQKPEENKKSKVRYQVQPGDYLGKIAQNFNVSIRSIKLWNNLNNNRLKIGQWLQLYPKNDVEKGNTAPKLYTVKKGDSLWSISRKFPGLTIQKIKAWNNMTHNRLKPGMKLKLSNG